MVSKKRRKNVTGCRVGGGGQRSAARALTCYFLAPVCQVSQSGREADSGLHSASVSPGCWRHLVACSDNSRCGGGRLCHHRSARRSRYAIRQSLLSDVAHTPISFSLLVNVIYLIICLSVCVKLYTFKCVLDCGI